MGYNNGKIEKKGGIDFVRDIYEPLGIAVPAAGPNFAHLFKIGRAHV